MDRGDWQAIVHGVAKIQTQLKRLNMQHAHNDNKAAAAAAAKSLQSCPILCDPIDNSPSGSPWDSPGKNTGVGCISFSNAWKWKMKGKSLSRVRLLATPWTAA